MCKNHGDTLLLALWKTQIDAMFKMQMGDSIEMLDDSRWWR